MEPVINFSWKSQEEKGWNPWIVLQFNRIEYVTEILYNVAFFITERELEQIRRGPLIFGSHPFEFHFKNSGIYIFLIYLIF